MKKERGAVKEGKKSQYTKKGQLVAQAHLAVQEDQLALRNNVYSTIDISPTSIPNMRPKREFGINSLSNSR
jgi:hypothetical protein